MMYRLESQWLQPRLHAFVLEDLLLAACFPFGFDFEEQKTAQIVTYRCSCACFERHVIVLDARPASMLILGSISRLGRTAVALQDFIGEEYKNPGKKSCVVLVRFALARSYAVLDNTLCLLIKVKESSSLSPPEMRAAVVSGRVCYLPLEYIGAECQFHITLLAGFRNEVGARASTNWSYWEGGSGAG
eukprot:6175605-Pleurochrysis_carterae.AAC.1